MTFEVTDKIYKWQDLGRGRFSEPLHPNMLLSSGCIQYGRYMLKGASESREDREEIYVCFNRDYAIQKLAISVAPLLLLSKDIEVCNFLDDLKKFILQQKFGKSELGETDGDK